MATFMRTGSNLEQSLFCLAQVRVKVITITVAPALEEKLLRVWSLTGNSSTSSPGQHQPRRGPNQILSTVQCDLHGEVSSWPSLLLSVLWTLQQVQVRRRGPRKPAFLACAVTTTWIDEWNSIKRMWSRKGLWCRWDACFPVYSWIYTKPPCTSFLGKGGIMRNKKI